VVAEWRCNSNRHRLEAKRGIVIVSFKDNIYEQKAIRDIVNPGESSQWAQHRVTKDKRSRG